MSLPSGLVDGRPQYRVIVGVDVASFGRREDYLQRRIRKETHCVLRDAFESSGLHWPEFPWYSDRGDGALIVLPIERLYRVMDSVYRNLCDGLRDHNLFLVEEARIALRMVIHVGFLGCDERGFTGRAIVLACRLLSCQAFKESMVSGRSCLGLIVSEEIYENVVRSRCGPIDPEDFVRVPVVNKETTTDAWVRLSRGHESAGTRVSAA